MARPIEQDEITQVSDSTQVRLVEMSRPRQPRAKVISAAAWIDYLMFVCPEDSWPSKRRTR